MTKKQIQNLPVGALLQWDDGGDIYRLVIRNDKKARRVTMLSFRWAFHHSGERRRHGIRGIPPAWTGGTEPARIHTFTDDELNGAYWSITNRIA
jgi:hypothetical protein